jgi:hypothetical protein
MKQIILAWSFIFVSQFTFAFTLVVNDSQMKGWRKNPLKFRLNTTSCGANDLNSALEKAVDLWNSAPSTNLQIEISGTSSATTYSSPPVIFCDNSFGSGGLANGADPAYVPGAGVVTTSNHTIVTGALVLNTSGSNGNIANFTTNQLSIILAHEIGHVIGLGHSEDSSSLMYYNASAKTDLALAQDDINGISYLYPRDELADDLPLACGSISSSLPPSHWPTRGTLLLLFLPLFLVLLIQKHTRMRQFLLQKTL